MMLQILITFSLCIFAIQGFVPAPGWADEVSCRYKEHKTLNRATCCGNSTYPNGIDNMDHWTECAIPSQVETETLDQTMWRIYSCIIGKALNGKPLNAESFTELVTKSYSDEKKRQIMARVKSSNIKIDGAATPIEKLRVIREAYYNAEIIECYYPKNVTIPSATTCLASLEGIHRRGSCCLNTTIPLSVIMPFTKEPEVLKHWKDLLETVSMNDPLVHGVTIQETCEITSDLLALGKLTKEDIFNTPNAEKVIEMVTPQFLTANQKQKLKEEALRLMKKSQKDELDPLIKAYILNAEKVYENSLKSELVDIKDEAKAKALFVTCIIHKKISVYVSSYVSKKCNSRE